MITICLTFLGTAKLFYCIFLQGTYLMPSIELLFTDRALCSKKKKKKKNLETGGNQRTEVLQAVFRNP